MRPFPKLFPLLLIGLFLLLSFNAYACLVPIYGSQKVSQGSDCSTPQEKSASQFCDGFKSLAVQSNSDLPSGSLSHVHPIAHDSSLFHAPVTNNPLLLLSARAFLPPLEDILILISVFRI